MKHSAFAMAAAMFAALSGAAWAEPSTFVKFDRRTPGRALSWVLLRSSDLNAADGWILVGRKYQDC
jgi:hypothetical protein